MPRKDLQLDLDRQTVFMSRRRAGVVENDAPFLARREAARPPNRLSDSLPATDHRDGTVGNREGVDGFRPLECIPTTDRTRND
jgi:hypothetical protein